LHFALSTYQALASLAPQSLNFLRKEWAKIHLRAFIISNILHALVKRLKQKSDFRYWLESVEITEFDLSPGFLVTWLWHWRTWLHICCRDFAQPVSYCGAIYWTTSPRDVVTSFDATNLERSQCIFCNLREPSWGSMLVESKVRRGNIPK
jgi:hypothetical protein